MKTRTNSLFNSGAMMALLFFIILATSTGCQKEIFCIKGNGDLVTVTLDLPEFTGFENKGAADIILTQGETQSVTITAQQNIIDRLERNVSRDIWDIDFKGCISRHKDITIEITLPVLTYAGISGAGTVTGTNRFTELGDVELSIAGSGDMLLDLDAQNVTSKIAGSGNIDLDLTANILSANTTGSGNYTLAGTVAQFSHNVSGSGECKAFGMETKGADIRISGSGDCETTVTENLDVDISGSGNVFYKGQPVINVKISGSGNLVNAN